MSNKALEEEFWRYVELGKNMPSQAPDIKLIAYGFFKQGSEGDNDQPRPTENSDVVRTFMHDQWKRLEGMSREEAMTKYISFLKELEAQQKKGATPSATSTTSTE